MRSRMDLHMRLIIAESLLCIAFVSGASLEAYPHIEGNLPYPGYDSRTLELPGYPGPEQNFAYTEVMTPFYHYYFYAPAFKTSPTEDFSQSNFHNSWRTPENGIFMQDRNSLPPKNINNGYYPTINDASDQNEILTPDHKFRYQFLQNPYSTVFTQASYNPSQTPSFSTTFLPTVLASGTPNIIRNEDQGNVHHDQSQIYASSYNDHIPHTFEPNPSYKPDRNPSLFSASPNIIRGEVPSVNKLFKPVSNSNKHNNNNPVSSPPTYRFSSSITPLNGVNRYNYFTTVPPTMSPISSSTPSIQSSLFPDYGVEETISPIFTSQTTLEGSTSPPLISQSASSRGLLANALEAQRVLFEAPGHPAPP
ncbi:uncharacterized protein LOC129002974 [Macrosteles quadrilineatus]|uniref:uncharacterized protein LOC129002974 n=1 Tax=Macrosteles quadrilineatus TaxID=74068 RepID=UPI0023E1E0A5|nr:uncharacterized protein LOC129002974 [Macrosteles quadrilineatus]